eukprot:CAMPEP_0181094044 /NCGR_PEP_ID=MMETSP1071-20121207/9778_1 /TAXON_ID=35127 /ORGANISM="Thalassiosira sp., Strain NH16" /LENGTH=914 /DNA_ID=CAMNT_0023176337 /DNA_START=206 /DNA_END=2950 /DNA_ORIENTATION=-
MSCANPKRDTRRRKLRPLVISLVPRNQNNDLSSSTDPTSSSNGSGEESRREQITRMFTTHPSLVAHFEPPIFSPGVPSRELRNRLKCLEHANRAGLIPEVEWEAICRAVSEQTSHDSVDASKAVPGGSQEQEDKATEGKQERKHKTIDPFRYLATTSKIQPNVHVTTDTTSTNKNENKSSKKNRWLEYQTTSLVPISPQRQGSDEDRSLPYSMEFWRKAKTLNRDRSVLACTLAHLMAMKTLVGEGESDTPDDDCRFDFILEDNVRAFADIGDAGEYPEEASTNGNHQTELSSECADRIWDIIDASNSVPSECHMRYYGWLGSLPNLSWIYENHVPRSEFRAASLQNDLARKCRIFPFPTNGDFELDSITATSKTKEQGEQTNGEASSAPHFTTPGGTAVWGTFAYTVSSAAYHSLINQLQNDVGAMLWKGKRMRAYQAKPVDKILPRHVLSKFGQESVHIPDRVAFVRGAMLGSLLHPQWEEGFCRSTERQYKLSCRGEAVSSSVPQNSSESTNDSDVWDHVWLTNEERQIVNHRKKSGRWVQKGDIAKIMQEVSNSYWSGGFVKSSRGLERVIRLVTIAVMTSFLSLGGDLYLHALLPSVFAFNIPIHNRCKRRNPMHMSSRAPEYERKRDKLGKVPIISRTIPVEINGLTGLSVKGEAERANGSAGNGIKRLDVTVWEMDKPSDLIQEWWSIDESERNARVGDPFGVVMWPGSILASEELMRQHYSSPDESPITNAEVLVLGAGTGVEAQTAALLGAKTVIATDINPLTLKLLEHGAKVDDRIGNTVEAKFFDLFSDQALPACDILIAADVLYNSDLAKQVGRRLHEAIVQSFEEGRPPVKVIITDSQQFHGTNFLEELAELLELNELFEQNNWEQLKWETQKLENVCGSGVLIDEDQIYDVDVRVVRWGW